MTIQVVAHITARPEKLDQVKEALLAMIEPTRKESGCLRYQLFQNNAEPADFTFTEEWADDAALDAHLATAHVGAVVARVDELLASPPDIRRYTLLG